MNTLVNQSELDRRVEELQKYNEKCELDSCDQENFGFKQLSNKNELALKIHNCFNDMSNDEKKALVADLYTDEKISRDLFSFFERERH